MLYLIAPGTELRWADVPTKLTLDLAELHASDLSKLEWLPSERAMEPAFVDLAMRYGVACSVGIAIDAGYIVTAVHAKTIRDANAAATASRAALADADRAMESIIPGWIEHGRQLDEGVQASVRRAIAEAEEEARDDIAAAEVRPALADHWRALGGRFPS